MKKNIRKAGAFIRQLFDRMYTFWRMREVEGNFIEALSYPESLFFFKYRSVLQGQNLVFYDIGAADGVLSRCLAKIKNVAEIHAFEPVQSAFTELVAHTSAYNKVRCYNVALGSTNEALDIWVIKDWRDSSSFFRMDPLHKKELPYASYKDQAEKVQVSRLDDFVSENNISFPDIIKIDVQGYEGHVLMGGEHTIRHAQFVILEMSFFPLYDGSPLFDEIYLQMKEYGFNLVGVTGELQGVSGNYLQVDGIFQKDEKKHDI